MVVRVHPRVHQKRPWLAEADVADAWEHYWRLQPRFSTEPTRYEAVGFDQRGRLLEMVAIIERRGDQQVYLVFHAQECTPAFLAQMGCSPTEIRNLIGGSSHGHGTSGGQRLSR